MKLFFISLLCIVPLINGRSNGGRATDTCIADYLASLGLIGSELASADPLSQLCLAIVEVTKGLLLKGVHQEVMKDKDMKPEADCIVNNMKSSNFSNYLLILYVYETNEGVSLEKKNEMKALIHKKLTYTIFHSFIMCQANGKFGRIYDTLLADESSTDEDDMDEKEDYCVRKRIVDFTLLDLSNVTIEINPNKIDTANIDCEALYQKAVKDGENELIKLLLEDDSSQESDEKSEKRKIEPTDVTCIVGVVREHNYFDQMAQFSYVKEMNLNEDSKQKMRNKFIKIMTNLAEDSSKCFL